MKIQHPSVSDPYRIALAHHQKKEYGEAKKLYLAVLQRQPQKVEAWVNLASVCDALGQREEALTYVEKALLLNPQVRDGYFNKGSILQRLRRYEEAIEAFHISLKYTPKDHDAYYYIGQCYFNLGLFDLALEAYKKASDIRPTFVSIYGAGLCYQNTNRFSAAAICFNECIKINPDDRQAQLKLLLCYQTLRDYPKLAMVLSMLQAMTNLTFEEKQELLFAKQELSIWDDEPYFTQQLTQATEQGVITAPSISVGPWRAIILPLSLSSRLLLAQKFVTNIEKKYQQHQFCHTKPKIAQPRRLRIAYLSMDFRLHATGFLIQSMFPLHDKARFEVFAYSYGRNDGSEIRKAIEQSVEHFVDIRNDSIFAAANKIAADGIDVLIDLAGFTTDSRFDIVALRPAPIQVNYLGYCLSTGSRAIDYFLGDKTIIQEEEERHYSEKIAYLPHTFMVINHQEKIHAELAGKREDWNLPEEGFVYGCFNATYKIEPIIFGLWMEILGAVPNSVLWLLSHHEIVSAHLRQEALKRGIDPQRLIFTPFKKREEHLARQLHMDLFLDTLQVNAVTTACDAIYMGVPVLTLGGDYILSRAGKSIMQAAGPWALTHQFIATDKGDYKQKAIHFGLHPHEFVALKKAFQEQRSQSPLFDIPARVKGLETAYEKMWALHQQGLPPQTFSV